MIYLSCGGFVMSDMAFAEVTEQVLSLSYDQTILLMEKMLESLKSKKAEDDYKRMENDTDIVI